MNEYVDLSGLGVRIGLLYTTYDPVCYMAAALSTFDRLSRDHAAYVAATRQQITQLLSS